MPPSSPHSSINLLEPANYTDGDSYPSACVAPPRMKPSFEDDDSSNTTEAFSNGGGASSPQHRPRGSPSALEPNPLATPTTSKRSRRFRLFGVFSSVKRKAALVHARDDTDPAKMMPLTSPPGDRRASILRDDVERERDSPEGYRGSGSGHVDHVVEPPLMAKLESTNDGSSSTDARSGTAGSVGSVSLPASEKAEAKPDALFPAFETLRSSAWGAATEISAAVIPSHTRRLSPASILTGLRSLKTALASFGLSTLLCSAQEPSIARKFVSSAGSVSLDWVLTEVDGP